MSDDKLPKRADLILGTGADVSKNGLSLSKQGIAITDKCVSLIRRGLSKHLMFTGGYSHNNGQTESELMAEQAERLLGDIDVDVYMENQSWRTHLNADYTLPMLESNDWKTVVIISQQWHARRVKAIFRKRWEGKGIQIHVIKAWSEYGVGGSQTRFDNWIKFAIWDTLAFVYSKYKRYC